VEDKKKGDWNFYKSDGTFIGSGDFNGKGVFPEREKSKEPINFEDITWSEETGYAEPNADSEFAKSFANEKRYIHKITKDDK
jgi:hypothetical protein